MAEKRLKRPRDPLQLAKLIGDIATGQVEDRKPPDSPASESGRRGGKERAGRMSAERRKEIALKAAAARWHKEKAR